VDNNVLIAQIKSSKSGYILDQEDDQSNEMAHFYFIGIYEGKQTVFDTFLYTLRMHHSSEMYEIVENAAAKRFPDFAKLKANFEPDDPEIPDELEEEIGLFMAEAILEIEEEESVKVKEHVDIDSSNETGVCMDVGLNVEEVTDDVIASFIQEFNDKELKLDETLHSYQSGE